MTPKEKAEELVTRFNPFTYTSVHAHKTSYENQDAKKCALIAVDEIWKQIDKNFIADANYLTLSEMRWNRIKEYWQQVKQEIENL